MWWFIACPMRVHNATARVHSTITAAPPTHHFDIGQSEIEEVLFVLVAVSLWHTEVVEPHALHVLILLLAKELLQLSEL